MSKKKTVKKTTTTTVVTEEVVGASKTQIVCILDASSSMNSIIDEARDGFNKFIDDQKELDDDASLTVATFSSGGPNNGYELLYDDVPIQNVEHLTYTDWNGNGMTALYDAIGKAITDISNAHKKLKKADRPDKVLFAIVTDGYENASREFDQGSIKTLIAKQEKQDWQFVYLAADQDATVASSAIGVGFGSTLSYTNTGAGNAVVFDTLSMASTNYRGMTKGSASFTSDSANLMSTLTDGSGIVGEKKLKSDKKKK